ncbi:TPA: hypothetical protein ACG1DY_005030, partial [Escherichia coli]
KAITAGSAKFDNSLDTLRNKADVLTRTFQTHQAKVEELRRRYEESKNAKGEDADQTVKLAAAYNRALAAMNKTEGQLKKVNAQIDEQTDVWGNLSRKVDGAGDSIKESGQKMRDIGQTLTTSVTLPVAGFAVAAGKAALDFDSAAGQIQAELGKTGEEAEKLTAAAEELWAEGFGEDLGSIANKVAGVSRALGDLSKVDLSYITKGLDLFERRGWADQQETLRAVKVLMEQFGMSTQEAMDYLTKGFQENLNYSGEFLDSVSEYSTYFSEFGLT